MTLAMSGLMAIVVAAAFAHPAAAAGPWRDFAGRRLDIQAQQQRGEPQRQPQRDFRRGERPPERDKRGDGRLTEEERRRLHRDLERANREIYKGQGR